MRVCKMCNKEYELSESGAGYKYCSQNCSDEARRIRKRERMRKVNNLYGKYEEQRYCKQCGKDINYKRFGTVFCSDGCRQTYYDRLKTVGDKDITLEKLFERDKGVCHICQRQCSFEDYTIRNGRFVAGKLYPSVDHVIPRSKDGVHSWDNIKLAHIYCNSIKKDCQDKREVIKRLRSKQVK